MEEIADGVFIETGYEGVNVGAILTSDGVICIDMPSYPRDARDWTNRVERLHGRGVRYLVLTDYHGDRILNTRWMSAPIITHQVVSEKLNAYDRRYPQQLIDSLIQRNPVLGREFTSSPVVQAAVSFSGKMSLRVADRSLILISRPGPTPGNIWVSWPDSGILFTGDSIVTGVHPPLGEMCLHDWIDSLERLEAGTHDAETIVPGRGEPGDPDAMIATLVSYLWHIAELVDQHIAAGLDRQGLTGRIREITRHFESRTPSPLPSLSPARTSSPDWIDLQVAMGLQRAYDEFLLASSEPVV
ncbi:MAG TPA: MBL fold metallo-hydrolase [Anaerolineae bacterium]|jgi:glyoxylase-like metal-dependent hydrolase (beta-lactamase superfamily II)|nr:MBL fold metallo-hydrolase [Anaerolineae bacterium]